MMLFYFLISLLFLAASQPLPLSSSFFVLPSNLKPQPSLSLHRFVSATLRAAIYIYIYTRTCILYRALELLLKKLALLVNITSILIHFPREKKKRKTEMKAGLLCLTPYLFFTFAVLLR